MKSVQANGSLLSSRYMSKTGVHELKVFTINELNKRIYYIFQNIE